MRFFSLFTSPQPVMPAKGPTPGDLLRLYEQSRDYPPRNHADRLRIDAARMGGFDHERADSRE